MQIIILGMHRSGTSAVGQLLEALGFEFGPKNLALRPQDYNPKGFWEREDVVELNDYALSQQGARWWTPGKWNPSELSSAFVQEFDRRAGEIIAGFSAERPWFLKDPRMCITAPLWEKHLDNPIYLITYRDPIEVSLSLWSREQLPQKTGVALWERYTADALNYTRDKQRLLIRYSDLVSDPKATLLALVSGINQFGIAVPSDAEAAIQKLDVDRKMRHHQRDALALEIPLTPSQEALNRGFRDGSILDSKETVDVSSANRQILAHPAAVEDGELQIREKKGSRASVDAKGTELPEKTSITGPAQRLAMAAAALNAYRPALEACARETVDALEEALLFGLHLQYIRRESELAKSRLQKFGGVLAGNDRAVDLLSVYCSQISQWNPLRAGYRRAKRHFGPLHSNPGKVLLQLIVSPELSGDHVPSALKAAEALLGDIILGRLDCLPGSELMTVLSSPEGEPQARINHAIALLKAFQCALEETANRSRAVLKATALFADHLEQSFGAEALLKSRNAVHRREKAITKLLDWGARLAEGHPFDSEFRKAKAEFKEFRKDAERQMEEPAFEQGEDTFRSMIPTVREAAKALEKFVGQCEETIAGIDKLAKVSVP